jgi:hypothetical protein
MEFVAEYLRRAEECRQLAQMTKIPAHRKTIQDVCDTWIRLADERRRHLVQERAKQGAQN